MPQNSCASRITLAPTASSTLIGTPLGATGALAPIAKPTERNMAKPRTTTAGSEEIGSTSWDEEMAAKVSPDGFIHGDDGSVMVPPLKPGEFPSGLEELRNRVSKAWRALGYSPSTHWVERWILKDPHKAADFADGNLEYPRNPWEHDTNDLPWRHP